MLRQNPYTATVHIYGGPKIRRRVVYKEWPLDAYGPYDEFWCPELRAEIPSWVQNAMSQDRVKANVDFLNGLAGRKASLIEEIRNGREAINTVATSVLRLSKMLRRAKRAPREFVTSSRRKGLRKGGGTVIQRQLNTLGDVWLEGRYHWLPTYLTMRDALINLQDLYPIGSCFHKSDWTRYPWSQTQSHPGMGDVTASYELAVQYKLGCWYRLDDDTLASLHRYGVGSLPDLATVAWELTPWSLVVDWVLPVSDLLQAFSALAGVTTMQDYQVEKIKIKLLDVNVQLNRPYEASDAYISYTEMSSPDSRLFEYEDYTRTCTDSSNLEKRLFLNTTPITWLRALDALSFFSGSEMSKKIISGKT